MAFSKKTYVSGQTAITADNLNAIQDELIRVGGSGTAPVADYVVAEGTSGNWRYRKWNSGVAECWGEVTINTAITEKLGAMAFTVTPYFAWPSGLFSTAPENIYASSVTTAPLLPVPRTTEGSSTRVRMYLLYPEPYADTINWVISVHAIGKWK